MKVKDMIDSLSKLPDDYDVCLSRFFSFPDEDDPDDGFQVILDSPIVGLMASDDSKEVRFILNSDIDIIKNDFPTAEIIPLIEQLIN